MRTILIAALALVACATEPTLAPDTAPIILSGDISRADHQTYKELPFTVPPGTKKITIDFAYNKENRTVIDLGLRDPQGQRGWSGGNKSHIEIGEFEGTPSYGIGPIQPGTWHLVLGVPNIREGQTAQYEATIAFAPPDGMKKEVGLADLSKPLSPASGWRRGDFHMHTAHSDGSCDIVGAISASANPPSTRGPCPAVRTFEAARAAGLDFAAITDHNTITQLQDIRELQSAFPKTLLIPGTEITTFNGHANAIGNTGFLDFQLGSLRLPTLGKLFDQVDAAGGFLSINHPSLPSGEACMGCGWTVRDTDWSRVTAMEVLNGSGMRTGGPEGPLSGIRFWDNLLKQGHRITAIGGSDNHDATDRTGAKQPPIGTPTTVVWANELSTKGIIAGVKSGRVFIDVAGLPEATLDMEARAGRQTVNMGGELRLNDDEAATITITRSAVGQDSKLVLIPVNITVTEPEVLESPIASRNRLRVAITLKPGATLGYIRPEVRDSSGKLLLLGNPIYVRAR